MIRPHDFDQGGEAPKPEPTPSFPNIQKQAEIVLNNRTKDFLREVSQLAEQMLGAEITCSAVVVGFQTEGEDGQLFRDTLVRHSGTAELIPEHLRHGSLAVAAKLKEKDHE